MFRPVDPESTITVISSKHDAAIDLEKSNSERWIEVYLKEPWAWREHIKPKDGEQLTEFVMGVIPPATLARIEDDSGISGGVLEDNRVRWASLFWESFKAACRDIKYGPTTEITKDGRKAQGVPKIKRNGIEYVDPVWLTQVCLGPLYEAALEVGGYAYRWQAMIGDDAKNS